jgi:CheY-like chemotaxis protein
MSLPSSSDAILVVEHLQINQLLLQGQLQKLGYSPDIVDSGEKALDAIMAKRYKLIFMEVGLTAMNGIEVTKIIRETEVQLKWPRAMIIAYIHNDSDELQQQCLAAGMDAFYIKPSLLGALSEILKRWLLDPHSL